MENTGTLDIITGGIALLIIGGGLFMLFNGMNSFPKDK
ncbi:MAG: hypothetical protein RLZZ338_4565 [Cyanobacteriota bacterium]|jgi:hypothetical protein